LDLTTGAMLRRILRADLSARAHKLATIILDGITWKDGYNGLPRGSAAFTLAALAEASGVSRQHLFVLLAELEASPLRLERHKPHGKFAPWVFRFAADEGERSPDVVSAPADTSLSGEESHKTFFTGLIEIDATPDPHRKAWLALIRAARTAQPCWNIDPQAIWDRFLAFNRARGTARVPAGFLPGFMRKWRTPGTAAPPASRVSADPPDPAQQALMALIKAAPSINRHFHAADLIRIIGKDGYSARISAIIARFGCQAFTATLAVHGQAVKAGEIRG
jgi:hypothetical protein